MLTGQEIVRVILLANSSLRRSHNAAAGPWLESNWATLHLLNYLFELKVLTLHLTSMRNLSTYSEQIFVRVSRLSVRSTYLPSK
jgi:hypothetical protein